MTDRNLNDLVAELKDKANLFVTQADAAISPSYVRIIVTWRSADDQAVAKAQGLSKAGPDESPHNCCLADGTPASRAFDFGVFSPDNSYVTDGKDPRYVQCGAIVESLGLVWGGSWTPAKDGCEPDDDHCELSDWRDV
jgi:hypothetical protein